MPAPHTLLRDPEVICDGNVVDKISLNVKDAYIFYFKVTSVQSEYKQSTIDSLGKYYWKG